MHRRTVLRAMAAAAAAVALPRPALAADPVPLPSARPIIFFTPHQDDETLFMGHAIAHHALAGREVHVVLVTDGRTSAARNAINGTASSPWWGGDHYPGREGYATLDEATFSAARTAELRSACGQLGVQPGNVHTAGLSETGLTVAAVQAVIEAYRAAYPTAGLYTMSWEDAQTNHAACGTALRNLAQADPVHYDDCRWLIKPEHRASVAWSSTYGVPAALAAQVDVMVERAVMAYGAWNPVQGSYAIGWHSVPAYFEQVLAGEPNYIHKVAGP